MRIKVRDLMSRQVPTIHPAATVADAIEKSFELETTRLYVTADKDRLVGIVPDYELLKSHVSGQASQASVESIMTRDVCVVSPDEPVMSVVPRFRSAHCSAVAVIDGDRLLGELTRRDVLWVSMTFERIQSNRDADDPAYVGPHDAGDPRDPAHELTAPNFLGLRRSYAARTSSGRG